MRKEWYKSKTGIIILVLFWPIIIPTMLIMKLYKNNKKSAYIVSAVAFIAIIGVAFVGINYADERLANNSDQTNRTQAVSDEKDVSKPQNDEKPQELIERLVKEESSKVSVTLLATDELQSGNDNNSPWVVVINSELNAFSSCQGAKETAYNMMKSIYTNALASENTALVKISLSPMFQIGLGVADAKSIDPDTWMMNGNTNFHKSLASAGADEDISKDPSARTYFKSINGTCTAFK